MASTLLLVWVLVGCAVTQANDLRFLGASYNLLKGNPDGTQSGSGKGGTDPGILGTRKVLKVSFDDDSALLVERHSCHTSETIYENSKAYQSKLKNEINVAGSVSYGSVSFSASAGFKSAREQTTNSHSLVHEKSTICYKGTVRYQMELVESKGFTITDSFASEICKLPSTYSTQTKNTYMSYLNRWGTHILTKLDLGTKDIMRKKTSSEDVLEYAEKSNSASVSLEASNGVASGSLNVDVSSFKSNQDFKKLFTSSLTQYMIGTDSLPEPIKLSLNEVTTFLVDKYWSNLNDLIPRQICSSGFQVSTIRTHMLQALRDYPNFLAVSAPQDSPVKVPLVWPEGTFGLPMPNLACSTQGSGATQTSACPTGTWYTGFRYHDTEDDDNANAVAPVNNCLNLAIGENLRWHFCMKHEAGGSFRLKWPKGTYCIFQKGTCPSGFQEGAIKYDDEDDNNGNSKSGHLPDGDYDRNTIYNFCCRNDRYVTTPIYLPTEKPFFLIAQNEFCQKVHGTVESKLILHWDSEDDDTSQYFNGLHPYNFGITNNVKLLLCYYRKI